MKDFFAENFGNFWEKVVLRKISGTFVFEKITSTSPPSPTFSGKIFAFRKKFLGGAWEGRGPKFWNTPPNRKPVGTAL
jgi:hypothetical protein